MSQSGSHAQFSQLPMFMSAREIKSQYAPWHGDFEEHEDGSKESPRELWDRKYMESMDYGYHMTIPKEGVRNPVALEVVNPWWQGHKEPEIMGGHHRIEVMSRHKPDALMPVEHVLNFREAQRSQASHDQADYDQQARGRR